MDPTRDPGLQPERTTLAWRRTVLSLAVGSLVALRLLPAPWGPWAGGAGLITSALLWPAAERRRHHSPAGAGLLLALTLVATAAAVLALVWLAVTTAQSTGAPLSGTEPSAT